MKRRYLKVIGLTLVIAIAAIAYYFGKMSGYYPNAIRHSKFLQITIGQTKDNVLKMLEGIPNNPTHEGFPGSVKKLKCNEPFTGVEFEGAPGTTAALLEDHFVVFFDQNNQVCDTMRYGL